MGDVLLALADLERARRRPVCSCSDPAWCPDRRRYRQAVAIAKAKAHRALDALGDS